MEPKNAIREKRKKNIDKEDDDEKEYSQRKAVR